jgi:NAD(P)H-flavin reductase
MTNIHEPFLTHVSQVEDVAKDTKRFRFRIASDVIPTFTPGQFFLLGVDEKPIVHIRLPAVHRFFQSSIC